MRIQLVQIAKKLRKKNEKQLSATTLFEKWEEERKQNPPTPWDEIHDVRLQIRDKIKDFWWHIKTHWRFYILRTNHAKEPIMIDDYAVKPCGYLDVCIRLPGVGRMHYYWIFTIETIYHLIYDVSYDDVQAKLYFHDTVSKEDRDGFREKNCAEFWEWLQGDGSKKLDIPIIEYDHVYTNKKELTDDDLLEYTTLWIKKWYPKLADRKVIVKQTENAEKPIVHRMGSCRGETR